MWIVCSPTFRLLRDEPITQLLNADSSSRIILESLLLAAMIFVAQVVSLVERTPPLTLVLLLTLLLLSALYAYKKLTEETHKVSLRL